MSDNELRKSIAEIAGFHTIQQNPLYPNDKNKLAGFHAGDDSALYGIPDYLNSIDAVRAVVLKQDREEQRRFESLLFYSGGLFHEKSARDWAVALAKACSKFKE